MPRKTKPKSSTATRKRAAQAKTNPADHAATVTRIAIAQNDAVETAGASSETGTARQDKPKLTVLTIGHSTRSIEEFLAILAAHGVQLLIDVRTIPKSRRVPQFNADSLAASLREQGIDYAHLKTLGGLRHAKKDSVNTGWRNASFRGYADYMASADFREGLQRLLQLAGGKHTAIMCAEAVPWRCHRSLIGDALLVRGVNVEDIMSATSRRPHELTSFAKVEGTEVVYPAESEQATLPLS